ncbi:MAG: class I SAM-dependent methyltransferase [Polyangiaceae bacterium]|nr:class I SAM-dependent methyltransferase [Polyangiaceae bacterium]
MTPLPICAFCGTAAGLRFRRDPYAIHRCEGCDFEWVYPAPSAQILGELYGGNYFVGEGLGYTDYFSRESASNKRKAEIRIALLNRLVPARGRLLDFGAASGVFVERAQAHGWKAVGVEPAESARAAAENTVQTSLFAELAPAAAHKPFDVITAWDVLEHLADAPRVLSTLAELMEAGGLVAVVVPVIENLNARMAPETWDQYKPPEHLTFFSRKSLKRALEQTVGPVIHMEPAWERYNRYFCGTEHTSSSLTRALGRVEGSVAKALTRLHVAPQRWFEDSVLMIARKEHNLS